MRRWVVLLVSLVTIALSVGMVHAQTEIVVTVILVPATATDTPTLTPTFTVTPGPSPTLTPSPTITATPTRTPDFVAEATVEVDGIGQDVAVIYQVSAGEFMIVFMLAILIGLLSVDLFLRVVRKS